MPQLVEDSAGAMIPAAKTRSRITWGKAGFWLALAGLVPFGLTLPAALAVSVVGLTRREGRRYAWAGLGISLTLILAYGYLVLPIVPFGTRAHLINRARFRLAWPQQAFWLKFDRGRLERIRTLKPPVSARYAVLFFAGPAGTFTPARVTEFARENGWKCHGQARFTAEQFRMPELGRIDVSKPEALGASQLYFSYTGDHTWQTKNVTVLAFDTGNVHGIPSFASVAEDGSAVEVRYQDPLLPDGPSGFRLPSGYEPLGGEPNRPG